MGVLRKGQGQARVEVQGPAWPRFLGRRLDKGRVRDTAKLAGDLGVRATLALGAWNRKRCRCQAQPA